MTVDAVAAARMRQAALLPLAAAAGAAVLWASVVAADPSDTGPVVCPWRWLTGLDCPFCGATRAVAALGRGDLGAALDHNAFVVLFVLPMLLAGWLAWLLSRTRRAGMGQGAAPSPAAGTVSLESGGASVPGAHRDGWVTSDQSKRDPTLTFIHVLLALTAVWWGLRLLVPWLGSGGA